MKMTGKLSLEELEAVSGGASSGDARERSQEFSSAWESLGFPDHGYTRLQRDAMCEQWEMDGCQVPAQDYLGGKKTW